MSLPKTIYYCEQHEGIGGTEQCEWAWRFKTPCNPVALRVAGPDDLLIRRENGIEFTLTDNGIGVEDKDQVVVGCCYDEGPYWNLEAGPYLITPLAAAEGGET